MSCCDFGAFYDDEGIMPPLHVCPKAAPLEMDIDRPLTDLERDLLRSLSPFTSSLFRRSWPRRSASYGAPAAARGGGSHQEAT